jgi:hypothetical protein
MKVVQSLKLSLPRLFKAKANATNNAIVGAAIK